MKNLNLLLILFMNEKKINKDKNILIKFERSPIINAINNNSLRYEVVSKEMPPPWSTPMTDDEINTIKNWIDCD